jgi:hypothetical protein
MFKFGVFALALFCAIHVSATNQNDDCSGSTFQFSNFNSVYIFNWLCSGPKAFSWQNICDGRLSNAKQKKIGDFKRGKK